MKTYGIIPSRYSSTRFPGKPLAILAGKPLVAWVVEAVKKAKSLDETLVATDDERIADAVRMRGGVAVMTPSELPSGTDRIAFAARVRAGELLGAADFADDDILVNIQGDEPLIDPALIDSLAMKLKLEAKWDMATAVTPLRSLEDYNAKSVVKVVTDRDGGAMYFSRAPIPVNRDAEPDFASGLYVRHLGIYAYRGAFLKKYIAEPPCEIERAEKLEQLRALWMGARIAIVKCDDQGIGVDTPEDARRVEAILEARSK
ncbi:MAG: 3-deoxy-manno-octulosonate cytidylyltransferase [Kiritimatiellae bacterium]|nr:3-deoxy-manno-octulosonate cytidylyltransferase [Kiritimatiellia bacterium]